MLVKKTTLQTLRVLSEEEQNTIKGGNNEIIITEDLNI